MIKSSYIVLFFFFGYVHIINAQPKDTLKSSTLRINAVGDIMMGTDFPRNRLPANDGEDLLTGVREILKSTDITFGNLEGTLKDGGKPIKKCRDTTKCYIFRTPTKYVSNLTDAGFNLISLANNHAFDFGESGIDTTMEILDSNNIKYSGKFGVHSSFQINGIKIGFIAFAPSDGCYSILNIDLAKKLVQQISDSVDVMIVSFHGGAEGPNAMHVADSMEIFLGEERGNVIQFAHSVIDVGADLVLGHGPHVPRAMELYKERLIAYSLGNFCTYEGFSILAEKGLAPILYTKLDSTGKFIRGKIHSAKQIRPAGTIIDATNTVFKLMAKLTSEDFPLSKIKFLDNGIFYNNYFEPPKLKKLYLKYKFTKGSKRQPIPAKQLSDTESL
jgi:hypothetical protein